MVRDSGVLKAAQVVGVFAVLLGSVLAYFFVSQSNQDGARARISERIVSNEVDIVSLKKMQIESRREFMAQGAEISKTREGVGNISVMQAVMASEQQKLSEEQKEISIKVDDLKTILIRMERGSP
jgi:hypothetical protein